MKDDWLFTLRVPLHDGTAATVHAFDGQHTGSLGHSRIDVVLKHHGKEIFPRGFTHCAVPSGTTIDGDDARELVLSLVAIKPGDTDSEFFETYSPEQIEWVQAFGDDVGQYAERYRCAECGAVNGRSKERWTGKRCSHHRKAS